MAALKSAFILLLLFCCLKLAQAGTYTLADGQTISGEPFSYDKNGIILGSATAKRTPWTKFSQDSLQQLAAEAKAQNRPKDAKFIEPFLEETILEARPVKKEIIIQEPPRVERPTGKIGLAAAFGSPLGLTIIFVLWGASLYAGYETARFRHHPVGLVCGVSAAVPVLGPVIFLCLPPKQPSFATEPTVATQPEPEAESEALAEDAVVTDTAPAYAVPPPPSPSAAPPHTFKLSASPADSTTDASAEALPAAVTFQRGDFTFNRRFFETKTPGFLRVVPSEADKDMVLYVRSARGELLGRRIARITQTELVLLTFKGEVTAEETVPFGEIYEVQLRHKDQV